MSNDKPIKWIGRIEMANGKIKEVCYITAKTESEALNTLSVFSLRLEKDGTVDLNDAVFTVKPYSEISIST